MPLVPVEMLNATTLWPESIKQLFSGNVHTQVLRVVPDRVKGI